MLQKEQEYLNKKASQYLMQPCPGLNCRLDSVAEEKFGGGRPSIQRNLCHSSLPVDASLSGAIITDQTYRGSRLSNNLDSNPSFYRTVEL